jgi:GLPGLI family protein
MRNYVIILVTISIFYFDSICVAQDNYLLAKYETSINGQPFYRSQLYMSENWVEFYTNKLSNAPEKVEFEITELSKKEHVEILLEFTGHVIIKKNLNEIVSGENLMSKVKYYKESLPNLSWNITSEQKMMDSLLCIKATLTHRCNDYVVWFAPSIPLHYGPWKLHGLPGLIVEAFDTKLRKVYRLLSAEQISKATFEKGAISITDNIEPLTNFKKDIKKLEKRLTQNLMEDCVDCDNHRKFSITTFECFE